MRRSQVRRLGVSSTLVLTLVACGGASSSAPPPDATERAIAGASERLEGSWRLVAFQPAEPLEPMLAMLLAAQMNRLTATFHAGTLHVEGAGLETDRAYAVRSAAADGFALTITDPTNVPYQVNGAFQGPLLTFTSLTDPWRGQGRLERLP